MPIEGNHNVKYKRYEMLDGSVKRLVERVGDGSIIKRFDNTPPPKEPKDVVCQHFLELKWANGCPFNCAWCYLQGTFRFLDRGKNPHFKDRDKIRCHLLSLFNENYQHKEVLNTGELSDSLMCENNGNPFSKFIIPLFEGHKNFKILFLSKSDFIGNIVSLEPNGNTIMSFSVNAEDVAEKWERGAPSVEKRIEAAKELTEIGSEVRLRIDPMVPVDGWKEKYFDLIEKIFSNFSPERITIGSLRGLQSTINNSEDKSWTKYLSDNSGWGKKIKFDLRFEMYSAIINRLKDEFGFKDVGLCKETVRMWEALGMDYRKIRCNCIW